MNTDPVYQALQEWITLTGVVPDAGNISLGDYDIKRCNDDLRETQEQDETGITTAMLLCSFMRNFTDNVEFTLTELVESPKESHDLITKVVDLKTELASPAIRDRIITFQETLRDAVKHYGFDSKKVQKLIKDEYSLAYVRRDAKRAFHELQEYQFLQGDEDVEEAKYNPNVHEFWSVNSMLEICKRAENGISVCLVRDPMGDASFFILVCKNGSVITILTDRPEWEHPNQKYMTRRPGRELGERMYRLRFPYDLLGIGKDSRGDKYVKKQHGQLVPYQTETIPVAKIADLKPDEIIWLILMFDQIKDKYWGQRYRTTQLGYTAEMIVESGRILEGIADLAVAEGYERIQVPVLATEDVTVESTLDQWLDEPTRANGWMEERYGDKVPASVLNGVGRARHALPFAGMAKTRKSELAKNLTTMDPTWFGTKEELVRDRMWVARFNKAQVVGALADEEFKKRKAEIEKWYKERVTANFQTLLNAMAKKEFVTIRQCWKDTFDQSGEERGNILRFRDLRTEDKEGREWASLGGAGQLHLAGRYVRKKDQWACYICKDRMTSMMWEFDPSTSRAVADLAGVPLDDLPDVIRHWREKDPYRGNSILARLDPMDWSIENPWRELRFSIVVRTCKRCLQRHAKSMGLKFAADGPAKVG